VGTLEIGLRTFAPLSPCLKSLVYLSEFSTDYEKLHTLPDLLRTSMLGFHPGLKRGAGRFNSHGLLSRDYRRAKTADTVRIVCLADSFGIPRPCAVPAQAMWTSVLENRLVSLWNRSVEVVSLAVPGVGPGFELRMWELEGSHLDADLVVIAFFVGNDFFE